MNWADFKIAITQGLVASAESVAKIISGATKVGNADKLDDKHASDFLLLSDYSTRIIGGTEVIDFNTLFETKNYAFSSNSISIALNAPVVSSGFLKVTKGGGYTHHEYTSNAGIRYFRTYNGSTWGSWKNAADGGNADTLDGYNSSKFRGNETDFTYNVKNGGNLNDYQTENHMFVMNMSNSPSGFYHGFLDVDVFNGTGFAPSDSKKLIRQTLSSWDSANTWRRVYNANTGVWSAWKKVSFYGDSSPVIVSATAPTDTTAVWIVP